MKGHITFKNYNIFPRDAGFSGKMLSYAVQFLNQNMWRWFHPNYYFW